MFTNITEEWYIDIIYRTYVINCCLCLSIIVETLTFKIQVSRADTFSLHMDVLLLQ